MAIAEISIVPVGTSDTSVSKYVADIISELKKSGLSYTLTPMGTLIEGDIKELFNIIGKLHESPFNKKAKRVYTVIKIDDRRDKSDIKMQDKIESVLKKI